MTLMENKNISDLNFFVQSQKGLCSKQQNNIRTEVDLTG